MKFEEKSEGRIDLDVVVEKMAPYTARCYHVAPSEKNKKNNWGEGRFILEESGRWIRSNKFVYTKAQSRVIGQEQLCPKIMKKMKFWTFWTFLKI